MLHPDEDNETEESLPDVHLNDLETAWPIYQKWIALGRRFLPSQILAEPTALLDDILAIEFVSWQLKESEHGR